MDDFVPDPRQLAAARFRACPLNVECPARCAFCYERRMSGLFPWITTVQIPPYDEHAFGRFEQLSAKAREWEEANAKEPIYGHLPALEMTPTGLAYYPTCDIFSTGLSAAQIEELIRLRAGDTCVLYSVGLNLDPELVAHLTRTYPETVRFHFSLVTFDPDLRRTVMHPEIDVDQLRAVCRVTRGATFFLMHFNQQQIMADVEELEELITPEKGGIYIHKLYTNRLDPPPLVRLAEAGERELEASLRALAARHHPVTVVVSPGAQIYAFTFRQALYPILERCSGEAHEAVFCSSGAHEVIAGYFADAANHVIPLASAFGGNVDFVQGTTAAAVAEGIERLRASGVELRSVKLPDAIFWIDQTYDLNGDTVARLIDAFGDLDFELLPVPFEMMGSVVSLDDCRRYYEARE